MGQDIAIQRELLRQVLERTAGQLKDIRSVHIGTLRALFYGHAGKKADLPYGLRAERTYRTVSVSQKKTHKSADALHGDDEMCIRDRINDEEENQKAIEEQAEYQKTDAYIEDLAREKLGSVHEDEIIFKKK